MCMTRIQLILNRADTICYGMLSKLPMIAPAGADSFGARSYAPAALDGRCVYIQDAEFMHIGHLKKRTAHIIRRLMVMDAVFLQFEVSRHQQVLPTLLESRNRKRKPVLKLSVIIYGPVDYIHVIGTFLVKCELYLQDPLTGRCTLKVPYLNPQSLWAKEGGQSRMIQDVALASPKDFFKAPPDLLQDLEYEKDLAKAPQPSALRTKLRE